MTDTPIPPTSDEEGAEGAPLEPREIAAHALGQLADFMQEANDQGAFDEPNAHNNALLATMALCGLAPQVISGDYIEANKILAEMASALLSALEVPRRQQGATMAGMVDGVNAQKEPVILKPRPMEVSQYGKKLNGDRGKKGKGR